MPTLRPTRSSPRHRLPRLGWWGALGLTGLLVGLTAARLVEARSVTESDWMAECSQAAEMPDVDEVIPPIPQPGQWSSKGFGDRERLDVEVEECGQKVLGTAGVDPLPSYKEWLAAPSPEKVADEQAARTAELAALDAWLDDHCLEDEEGEDAR